MAPAGDEVQADQLPTILALCRSHLTDPKLRERAMLVGDRLALVNRNDLGEERPTFMFTYGDKVYSPWDVADLFMHGAVFHGRDRDKRQILESLSTGALAQLNFAFRMYVTDVTEALLGTRLILLEAKETGALSDKPL